jgi:hypothetical protein
MEQQDVIPVLGIGAKQKLAKEFLKNYFYLVCIPERIIENLRLSRIYTYFPFLGGGTLHRDSIGPGGRIQSIYSMYSLLKYLSKDSLPPPTQPPLPTSVSRLLTAQFC